MACPGTALAWGSPGHQYVGNLAWALLNPNARHRVRQLLGPNVTLGEAAVWPDCVRSVNGSPSTSFHYDSDQFTPDACAVFGNTPSEVQRMTGYASRNWTNCDYAGHNIKCHQSFHFADINVREHETYDETFFGAEPYDVVHAITAAVTVLKCKPSQVCPVPQPFSIIDKREALFLLAHFVGDVHQPLHVGAVYLDANNAEGDDQGRATTGGNSLLLSPGDKADNLHHAWDTVSVGTTPTSLAKSQACLISPLPNPTAEPPEKWASESVVAARRAYEHVSFTPDGTLPDKWDVQFENKPEYSKDRRTAQAQRLIAGGARLAAILNSIWPSHTKAAACS